MICFQIIYTEIGPYDLVLGKIYRKFSGIGKTIGFVDKILKSLKNLL